MGIMDIIKGIGNVVGIGGDVKDLLSSQSGYDAGDHAESIRTHWSQTMAMANRFGIHPLVAMGINPSQGGYANLGPSTGKKLQSLGQSIRRLPESATDKARARLDNAKAALIERDLADIPGQVDKITEEDLPAPAARHYEKQLKPMEMVTINSNGMLDFFPSRDTQDYLSEAAIENFKYMVQKEWSGYKNSINVQTGMIKGDAEIRLRDRLDELEMYFPPRPGHYYAFNTTMGRPRQIRNNKYGRKKLIDSKNSRISRYAGFGDWRNK